MLNSFDSSEIVKLGIQIEKNGRDFYDHASKTVKADKVRQVFEYLYSEEQAHIAVFESVLNKIDEGYQPAEKHTAEYAEYLGALVEENLFTKAKQGYEVARTIKNDKQALEISLGIEKDSILFYSEMKKVLEAGVHGDIDKLIASEQEHFKRLSDVLKGFNKFGVGRNRE
jgi:rubrerythrin